MSRKTLSADWKKALVYNNCLCAEGRCCAHGSHLKRGQWAQCIVMSLCNSQLWWSPPSSWKQHSAAALFRCIQHIRDLPRPLPTTLWTVVAISFTHTLTASVSWNQQKYSSLPTLGSSDSIWWKVNHNNLCQIHPLTSADWMWWPHLAFNADTIQNYSCA